MVHENTCRGRVHPCPRNAGRGEPCPYMVSVALMFFLIFPAILFPQSDTSYQQGYTQYKQNYFDSAIASFSQLISEHPEKKEGYYNRGLSYYHLNKLAEAQHDFNACLQIDSVFDDARFMKVLILQRQGKWKSANAEIKSLNTSYAGYNELQKHSHYHNISVILSRNWYYMIAIMFMFVILVGIIAKSYYTYKG
jgi:tetratricopeptide (TPR) repeat protein